MLENIGDDLLNFGKNSPMTELRAFPFAAMGTDCVLYLDAERAVAEDVAATAMAEVFRIEAAYSRYREDSVLSHINRIADAGGFVDVDAETAGLLDYAYAGHRKSDGLFDITSGVLRRAWDFASPRLPPQKEIDRLLPRIGLDQVEWQPPRLTFRIPGMELDFGGIGKEYAADRVADICIAAGIASGLVDLGGDVRALGPRADGTSWTVHIRDSRRPESALARVALAGGAIASSGDYERYVEVDSKRYCHLMNPKTGWPVSGLAAVSVVADRCLVAGTISTTAMLKGVDGPAWLDGLGIRHLWVDAYGIRGGNLDALPTDDQGKVLITP